MNYKTKMKLLSLSAAGVVLITALGVNANKKSETSIASISSSSDIQSDYSGLLDEVKEFGDYRIYKYDLSSFCDNNGELVNPIPVSITTLKDCIGYRVEKLVTTIESLPTDSYKVSYEETQMVIQSYLESNSLTKSQE